MKIFWVSKTEENTQKEELEVKKEEYFSSEEEIGQIALDIIEIDEEIFIVAPIAGVRLEDIEVSLNKTVLTIKGRREMPDFYDERGVKIRNDECFWGAFIRNIILPENLDFDSIKAEMQNNLLTLSIQKLRFSSQYIKIDNMK